MHTFSQVTCEYTTVVHCHPLSVSLLAASWYIESTCQIIPVCCFVFCEIPVAYCVSVPDSSSSTWTQGRQSNKSLLPVMPRRKSFQDKFSEKKIRKLKLRRKLHGYIATLCYACVCKLIPFQLLASVGTWFRDTSWSSLHLTFLTSWCFMMFLLWARLQTDLSTKSFSLASWSHLQDPILKAIIQLHHTQSNQTQSHTLRSEVTLQFKVSRIKPNYKTNRTRSHTWHSHCNTLECDLQV